MRYLIRHLSALNSPAAVSAMEPLQQVQQHPHPTFACLTLIAEAAGIAEMFHATRGSAVRSGGALITVFPAKPSSSESRAWQGLNTSETWHLYYAGASTGVFAEEEDGFDDALAGLDVDQVVAASQQGTQSQHSSPSGRPGGHASSYHIDGEFHHRGCLWTVTPFNNSHVIGQLGTQQV